MSSPNRNTNSWADGEKGEKECSCAHKYTASEYARHMHPDANGVVEHNSNMEKKRGVQLG